MENQQQLQKQEEEEVKENNNAEQAKSQLGISGSVCIQYLEENLPEKAYSKEQSTACWSYLPKNHQINQEALAPLYVHYDIWQQLKGIKMKDRFNGQKLNKTYELVCIDKELIKNQKGMFTELIKKLASSLYKGRGVVGVSLPVRIFEPRSLLTRITDWWTLMPHYMNLAAKTNDKVERFKLLISAIIGGIHMGISQWKPFNPILGETYQGTFSDTTIDIEHISHHPPIAAFYLVNKLWKMSGSYEFTGTMNKNSVSIAQEGRNTLTFNDGQKIVFYYPYCKVGGTLMGERSNKLQGCMVMFDAANSLKSVIKFDQGSSGFFGLSKKRSDILKGLIYTVKEGTTMPLYKNYSKMEKANIKMKDQVKKIAKIEGSWLSQILINDKEYWNMRKQRPERAKPIAHPLPFDWRFREDLLYCKYKDNKRAAIWKHNLEQQQRHERKLRQVNAKKCGLKYHK